MNETSWPRSTDPEGEDVGVTMDGPGTTLNESAGLVTEYSFASVTVTLME